MAVLVYRDLVGRIRSAQKTQQITKTMQMVAASRLKKSQDKFVQSKPYLEGITEILGHLQQTDIPLAHPLLTARPIKKVALVLVTSDRGLCGTYNANIIHHAEAFLNDQHNSAELIVIGKKGDDYFKKRPWPIFKRYLDVAGKADFDQMIQITEALKSAFISGQFDAIYLAYTVYKSAMMIHPDLIRLFPIVREHDEPDTPLPFSGRNNASGIFSHPLGNRPSQSFPPSTRRGVKTYLEPSGLIILDQLLSSYVTSKIYVALLEAATAENSARMIAMKNATDNAHEMIRHLTLLRNKARQGAITRELIEMVTGSEALRN